MKYCIRLVCVPGALNSSSEYCNFLNVYIIMAHNYVVVRELGNSVSMMFQVEHDRKGEWRAGERP